MKNNNTYRSIAALFFAVLVIQVFVLQGLHHVIGHHDHEEALSCDLEDLHIHAEGHEHFSCDICLFHFAPTDSQFEEIALQLPPAILFVANFTYCADTFTQSFRQSCLRGPPSHRC